MKKEELLKKLKESLLWEDTFISNYNTPTFWTLIEGSFPQNTFLQIKKLFSVNISDTKKHGRILKKLISQIEKSDRNEY